MYLTGVSNDDVVALKRPDIGLMCQPGNSYHLQIDRYPAFAADSGCYGGKFNADKWRLMLDRIAPWGERCLFCAVPDRFDPNDLAGNHAATLDLWGRWSHEVTDRGLVAGFVCQNGSTPDDVPPEARAVFIGGDTEWKLSRWAWAHIAAAKARGRWAHVGRCNSEKRVRSVSVFGADSADGTFLKHGPDVNLPKLVSWLDGLNNRPHLSLTGAP